MKFCNFYYVTLMIFTLSILTSQELKSQTTATACNSYTWSTNGQTYTASGTYYAVDSSFYRSDASWLSACAAAGLTNSSIQTFNSNVSSGSFGSVSWSAYSTQGFYYVGNPHYIQTADRIADSIKITFNPGVSAVAGNFYATKADGSCSNDGRTTTLTLSNGYSITYVANNLSQTFRGFIANTGSLITSITINGYLSPSSGKEYTAMDNLQIATGTVPSLNLTINPLPDATINASGATTFTYGNSVTLSAPSVGNALTFNGTSNYVSIPSNINNAITGNNLTVEGWFFTSSTFNLTGLITESLGTDNNVKLGITSGVVSGVQKIYAGFTNNGTSTSVTSTANLPMNTWTHIAATYDGASLKVYVNGTLTGTVANASGLPSGADAWYFGKAASGSNLFPGTMDEIRIWNVVRTQSEINANKNAIISTSTTGLKGYYKLDETSGTNAADATGNGYTGTVN